jgi:hypothetical protein
VLDLSFTKMRGISIEVTLIGVPSCVTHLFLGLGFSQTTNCAIIGPTCSVLVVALYEITLFE